MSIIDQRVVQMVFDNHAFEQGIATTLGSLGKLTKGLQLQGGTKGLTDVGAAAKGLSLESVASGVENIASRFKTMSIVGITALTSISNKAINAGITLAKSLTIDPIKAGFQNYETQINAVQTILANTASAGTKLSQVNKVLAELNTYANQTVYNFSDMAKNIGTFTAAGVGLNTSVNAIKGIANLAAFSGSNAEQASTAMYQLSQALAAGKVNLQDWNSVVNAGLGGKTFQTALINTARVSGVAIDSIIKKQGSFRNSLQKGWLTSDILTKTLSQFTGDLTLKQIKAMGYTAKQAKQIYDMGQTAVGAATKIKTVTQLGQALKEEVATAYASVFKTIFGNITQATDLFTGIHNVAEKALTAPVYALNTLLQGWDKLGGRKVLIQGISDAFHILSSAMNIVKSAFREIFPPTTAKQLYEMTVSFRDFMERLKLGGTTANELKRTFAGVFAVLGIGWDVLKQIGKTLFGLFGMLAGGSGGFLKATASIGDFLVKLKLAIEQGGFLTRFFQDLGMVLAVPLKLLQLVGSYVGSLFSKFDSSKVSQATKSLGDVGAKLSPISKLGQLADAAWSKFIDHLKGLASFFSPLAKKMGDFFGNLWKQITSGAGSINFADVLHTINTGLFAGLLLLVKKFVDKFRGDGGGPLSGFVTSIKETFEGLTKTLKTMQGTLKAATLLEIAAAVGLLTISMSVLSKIDTQGLIRSSTAITVMFTQLVISMAIFQKFVGTAGFLKMPFMMASLILLATAIDILVVAVKKLSTLDWNSLAKGLTALTVMLAALAGAVKLMGNPAGMISTGLGLLALSKGITLLVGSVTILSGLSWEQLGKGLVSVGALLLSLTLFSKFAQANAAGAVQGLGIILLATGIKILAGAMKDFVGFSWQQIGKGLVAMGGGLAIIAGALYLIPPSSVLSAAAVLIVATSLGLIGDAISKMGKQNWSTIGKGVAELAGALTLIAAALYLLPPSSLLSAAAILIVAASLSLITDALVKMGGQSWSTIAKSLVELAGALGIIAGAVILMTSALPGAAALLVVAASLMILNPVLQAFGKMSWTELGKSLLMVAGVFVILGLAGLVLGPVVPVLLGLGAAIVLLGVGMATAGLGVFLFATALTALSVAGTAGAAALVAVVTAMLGLLPLAATQIGLAVVAFAKTISTAGPAITKAITTVLLAIINAIATVTPKIVTTLLRLLTMMLQQLANYVPKMVSAGLRLLVGILNGIANNIGRVVTSATNVIVNFLNGISKNMPRIIQAGVTLIISFVNGLSKAIDNNSKAMGQAGGRLATSIIEGMVTGLASGVGTVASAAGHVAKSAIDSAKSILHINSPSKEFIKIGQSVNEGFYKGLTSGNAKDVDKAFNSLKNSLALVIASSGNSIDSLEKKLNKLESARHKNRTEIAATKQELSKMLSEHKKEISTYDEVTKGLVKQHKALDTLANKYDVVTAKLQNANNQLANSIKTRDDYNKQIKDQFSTLPTISAGETVATYEQDLSKQIEKTKEFANVLQRLRKLGLSDVAYKQLLSQGIDALPFAQQLLDNGKAGVSQLNDLNNQLTTAAGALGKTASSDLYQAAVDSAKGLVDGLKKQQKALEKQMEALADAMVNAIKHKLGIKSPSTVFREVGGFSAQGLAAGLDEMSGIVEKSAAAIGDKAVVSLAKSLSGMSDLVAGNIDIRPTITPVLDLSSVKKGANQIGNLLAPAPISVTDAYSKAVIASTGHMSNLVPAVPAPTPKPDPSPVTFNQYNNSPVALSAADIYRQTKNQLSRARGFYVYQDGSTQQ